jgi:endonuclease/exonuclease/phosphatase family metal-dependent hydrolase
MFRAVAALTLVVWQLRPAAAQQPATFRVATYNIENFLDQPSGNRATKTSDARAKVIETIIALDADILALQEVGGPSALAGLRASLRHQGLDYPFAELVHGPDTNAHIAVLSRFPFLKQASHTNDSFLLHGRRFRVARGFAELEIGVRPDYQLTLLAAHLKSQRAVPEADEAELREHEAIVLRQKIDRLLAARPELNLVLLGDLNDGRDSRAVRAVLGRGKRALVDTRPAERFVVGTGDGAAARADTNVVWTYYYPRTDQYSRLDYILLSPGLAREWVPEASFVLALPGWHVGSDHRPVVATFQASDVFRRF